jgi:HTH-type transcriptional regulator / antitoxin HipB
MRIRTPIDLGALIRERRKALRLDQKTLAEKVGVSRQWIVDVEQGKPRLEIGLVLRTADALGIVLTVDKPTKGTSLVQPVILDSIVDAARKRRK